MTLGDIKNRVWDRLGEDSADPQRYTAALIEGIAQEATRVWSVEVGYDVASTQITLLDDTLSYSLPTNFINVVNVIDDQNNLHIDPTTWQELYRSEGNGTNRRWRDVRSDRPTHYVVFSYDELWLWPPMSSAGGNTVTVVYQREVTGDLDAGDSDVPIILVEYQPALIDYIVGRCLLINARGPRVEEAGGYIARWGRALDQAKQDRMNKAHNWAPTGRVLNNGKPTNL